MFQGARKLVLFDSWHFCRRVKPNKCLFVIEMNITYTRSSLLSSRLAKRGLVYTNLLAIVDLTNKLTKKERKIQTPVLSELFWSKP